jgi:hypothetical protein
MTAGECTAQTHPHQYLGDGTECVPNPCPALGVTPGDAGRKIGLLAPVPNPFHAATTISFQLAQAGPVRLEIFDLTGRLVRTLVRGPAPFGSSTATWDGRAEDGSRVIAGVYFCRLSHSGGDEARAIILVE